MKKILIILLIFVIIFLGVFFIYKSNEIKDGGVGDSKVGFSIRDFIPFGQNNDTKIDTNFVPNQNQTTTEENINEQKIPKLRKLSKEPISGYIVLENGSSTKIRFSEKGTGNVYEASTDNLKTERLTNTTIPKIYRSFWLKDGSGFITQNLIQGTNLIETNFVKISKKDNTNTEDITLYDTKISKLPLEIKELAINQNTKKIIYYISKNQSSWYIANIDGTNSTFLLNHPLTEWLPVWLSDNEVLLQTKSNSEYLSYTYILNIKNKTITKKGFGFLGLSIKNKDSELNLVSSGGEVPNLYLVEHKTDKIYNLEINTFSDKCEWLKQDKNSVYCAIPSEIPKAKYPEDWYKGVVSTKDDLIKIDTKTNVTYRINDLYNTINEYFDIYNIQISKNDNYITFINKNDGFLWLFRTTDE